MRAVLRFFRSCWRVLLVCLRIIGFALYGVVCAGLVGRLAVHVFTRIN